MLQQPMSYETDSKVQGLEVHVHADNHVRQVNHAHEHIEVISYGVLIGAEKAGRYTSYARSKPEKRW